MTMLLQRWTPNHFAPFRLVDSELDGWINSFFGRAVEPSTSFVPRVDLIENPDQISLRADVPGFKPEDIEVKVENGTLSIRGRRSEENTKAQTYHVYERSYGEFARSFALPASVD